MKPPQKQLNEVETGNIPEKEFKTLRFDGEIKLSRQVKLKEFSTTKPALP